MNHENRKSLLSGLAVFYALPTIHGSSGSLARSTWGAAVGADKQREQAEKARKRLRWSLGHDAR